MEIKPITKKLTKHIIKNDIEIIKFLLLNEAVKIKVSNTTILPKITANFKDAKIVSQCKYEIEIMIQNKQDEILSNFNHYNLLKSNPPAHNNIEKEKIIINELKKTSPSVNDLAWIKKTNIRQCYYIASVLYLSDNLSVDKSSILSFMSENKLIEFEKHVIKRSSSIADDHISEHLTLSAPESIYMLYDHILLNLIKDYMFSSGIKNQNLYKLWIEASNEYQHDWIDKENKEQIDWISDYLRKNHLYTWFLPEINKYDYLHKYHSCIVIFDLWSASQKINGLGNKYEFIEKMKRSWSQQKSRLKNKNKKTFTFSMESNVESKIDKLCKDNHINKSKLIEKLINDAFDSL